MNKITFMGAGSTVFARKVLGDSMCDPVLCDWEYALYDIDAVRLSESAEILGRLNDALGNKAHISTYLGVENRKEALRGARFVVNAIQVGLYDPCTIIDFEVPKKYGLRQTIADSLGIGGIMRGLRTIPVVNDFARDMAEVCPDALFLNYVNPMAIVSGFMERYTPIATVGLCHSVQSCTSSLIKSLGMEGDPMFDDCKEYIAGINHMAWLLKLEDKNGNDLYPFVRNKAAEILAHDLNCDEKSTINLVRLDYIRRFGYYVTESSEHNSEYNMFYIKDKYPELISKFAIPLDEYPRRCVNQIAGWAKERDQLRSGEIKPEHTMSREYAVRIMESCVTGNAFQFNGNVINKGNLIENLPSDACVEVPCLTNKNGVLPTYVGRLPVQCAAMNMTNINVQLLTIEAAVTHKRDAVYQAAFLDPHTASELDMDTIVKMVDELIDAHGSYLPEFH